MYSGPFLVGTLLACRSTPNDGKTDGDFAEDTATIQNTAPVVDSVMLSPSTVYTNDTITATAVLSDGDSSQSGSLTANYEWFVDNVSVQNGSSNTLDGVSMFNRDQSVYVEVTPNDGVEDGTVVQSSAITISNTAPVMSSVTVTPDPATAGQDDLTCDVVATDADGDSVVYTYEWSDSSGVQQTMTEVSDVSDTFLAAGLAEDTWSCEVTPYDGTDYGSAVSDSVTVESGCSSLSFDGQGDYVQNNSFSFSNNGASFTVSVWVTFGQNMLQSGYNPTHGGMIGQWYDPSNSGWIVYFRKHYSDTGLGFIFGSQILQTDWSPSANTWHHIVLVKDGTQKHLYIDKEFIGTENAPSTFTSNYPLELGRIGPSDPDYPGTFEGLISGVKIWEEAFSAGEVSDLYTSNVYQSQPVLNWDSGTSTILEDSSGNGHHGTINGAIWVNSCPEEDLDGDGVAAWEDCDDSDASIGSSSNDADCDGVATSDDCDDNDSAVGSSLNDSDCDGVTVSAGDCDDNDASIYPFAGDTYGDGIDSDCDNLDCEGLDAGSVYYIICPQSVSSQSMGESICQNNGYDGLASMHDQSELSAFNSLPTSSYRQAASNLRGSGHVVWISLNDIQSEGSFVWGTGVSLSYSNWYSSEPNNSGGEDCVEHYFSTRPTYGTGWNDLTCAHGQLPFSCEFRY